MAAKKKTAAKKATPRKLTRTLPGDKPKDADIASMIRVNHAGEYGARRIYQGQLSVLGRDPRLKKIIEHMAEQEEAHLAYFENELVERRVRPSALHPIWHVAGFALGAATARISPEAAMACTVAVETVISEHYQSQLDALDGNNDEKKLRTAIAKFKAEEEEHHDIGIENDAEQAQAYPVLSGLIRAGTRLVIEIAKRV